MKVLVVGLRGFPDIQGGNETHSENLYPRLVQLGVEVEVITRSTYWGPDKPAQHKGVTLTSLWTPAHPKLETFVHSFLAVLMAVFKRPDVLHVHAVGPALFVPLARLAGLNVVVTHHGPDYDREKWARFPSWILRAGERLGMRWAQSRIVISKTIQQLVEAKHQRSSDLIPNGVPPATRSKTSNWLVAQGVSPGKYVVQVSRLVPEKRQLDLVQAFEASDASSAGWNLLLVGALDSDDDYQNQLRAAALANPQIILTDFQTGKALQEILTHAGAFVLPSSHEGLPIALLEALSYSLRAFASDIPANLEVPLPAGQFFGLGDIAALADLLSEASRNTWSEADRAGALAITEKYDWDLIAEQTLAVYQRSVEH